MSVIASVGWNAQFHCAGAGGMLLWIVDGVPHHYNIIEDRGIFDITNNNISSGTVQSTLTVPATSVNNGTTVQCAIYSQLSVALSNNATLTILSGEFSMIMASSLICSHALPFIGSHFCDQ